MGDSSTEETKMIVPPWLSRVLSESEHLALDSTSDRARLAEKIMEALQAQPVAATIGKIIGESASTVLAAKNTVNLMREVNAADPDSRARFATRVGAEIGRNASQTVVFWLSGEL